MNMSETFYPEFHWRSPRWGYGLGYLCWSERTVSIRIATATISLPSS